MKRPKVLIKNTIFAIVRRLNSWRRPSRSVNEKRLRQRDETIDSIRFRELTANDVAALASIHVKTWIETYSPVTKSGPSVQTREHQWREKFRNKEESWFIIGVENKNGEMIGFQAMGIHSMVDMDGKISVKY